MWYDSAFTGSILFSAKSNGRVAKEITVFVIFRLFGAQTMDRKAEGRHRSGRRTLDRRIADEPDFSGPDRRSGEDRRATADRRRRPH